MNTLVKKTNNLKKLKQEFLIGDIVLVSPELTLLTDWVKGTVIKIFKNPFIGDEVAIKDEQGRIFFGEKSYFKTFKNQ